jgi:outer membrane lipoprotein SlyB
MFLLLKGLISMKKNLTPIFLICVVAVTATGCARNLSPNFYSSAEVGETIQTVEGTIVQVRTVTIGESDKLAGNVAGLAAGGVLGGVVGHQFGKGGGRQLATAAGAALGALGGAFAEQKLSEQQGFEYTVNLIDGRTVTVVQGAEPAFTTGQRVKVQMTSRGRSRVVAF